jgi:t-SNARE complex subunit (syntaxin)
VNPEATERDLERVITGDAKSHEVFATQLVSTRREVVATQAMDDCKYRHEQITKLVKSIKDLQQLFKDMQSIVKTQDALCLSVSSYVDDTVMYTEEATKEVKSAVHIQKTVRKVRIEFLWRDF